MAYEGIDLEAVGKLPDNCLKGGARPSLRKIDALLNIHGRVNHEVDCLSYSVNLAALCVNFRGQFSLNIGFLIFYKHFTAQLL